MREHELRTDRDEKLGKLVTVSQRVYRQVIRGPLAEFAGDPLETVSGSYMVHSSGSLILAMATYYRGLSPVYRVRQNLLTQVPPWEASVVDYS